MLRLAFPFPARNMTRFVESLPLLTIGVFHAKNARPFDRHLLSDPRWVCLLKLFVEPAEQHPSNRR